MKLSSASGLVLLFAASAHAGDSICFVPGLWGGNPLNNPSVARRVAEKGIPWRFFDVGKRGTVQERADRLVNLMTAELRADPSLRCHAIGYSMGGLILRYAMNHLSVPTPLGPRPFRDVLLTVTSLSSPHRGSPLARIPNQYLPGIDEGADQMSESNVAPFNDPASPFYSPALPEIPFFSFRAFISDAGEMGDWTRWMSWTLIAEFLKGDGLDPRNDGIVPYESQSFGTVLGEVQAPHEYWSKGAMGRAGVEALEDFYDRYWTTLQNL